ncbi:MAG: hypothetical protein KAW46_00250 [candidate division Zixibacteria bacterium]|nr:hypothetical protein [candidate division Zixibacteria bacterium]
MPLVIYTHGDGGKSPDAVYRIAPPIFGSFGIPPSSSTPPSPDFFPTGYVGPVRIAMDNRDPVITNVKLPESSPLSVPAPEAPSWLDSIPGEYQNALPSSETDFGLPGPPPIWSFTSRGLPSGVRNEKIGSSAQAILANPVWPERVWLEDDTATVEGWLTLHSYGLMSFELISETHAGDGFGAAVKEAVERGWCIPAADSRDNRITVRCRYRCLFFHGGETAVSVDGAIRATVQ